MYWHRSPIYNNRRLELKQASSIDNLHVLIFGQLLKNIPRYINGAPIRFTV